MAEIRACMVTLAVAGMLAVVAWAMLSLAGCAQDGGAETFTGPTAALTDLGVEVGCFWYRMNPPAGKLKSIAVS